jgi:threonine/homoserine/homoserine lactone efflux protein
VHYAGQRLGASPLFISVLSKLAGVFLIGFGIKLAIDF